MTQFRKPFPSAPILPRHDTPPSPIPPPPVSLDGRVARLEGEVRQLARTVRAVDGARLDGDVALGKRLDAVEEAESNSSVARLIAETETKVKAANELASKAAAEKLEAAAEKRRDRWIGFVLGLASGLLLLLATQLLGGHK